MSQLQLNTNTNFDTKMTLHHPPPPTTHHHHLCDLDEVKLEPAQDKDEPKADELLDTGRSTKADKESNHIEASYFV